MTSNLDELVMDLNRFEHAKIIIYVHTGDKVETQSFTYHGLSIRKDTEGGLGLGDYETGNVYVINHKDLIEKQSDSVDPATIHYYISRDDIYIAHVYLY